MEEPIEHKSFDKSFGVETLALTNFPNILIYKAMHTDYSPNFVPEEDLSHISERRAGEIITQKLLKVGHWGPLEHPQITFAVGYFPHFVMVQGRTHRIGTSWDVQSLRYTGKQVVDVAEGRMELEKVFYFRPPGRYSDRHGKKYDYTYVDRVHDMERTRRACEVYAEKLARGMSEEHAREGIPQNIRQHFVVSFNMRSLCHFLAVRSPADAQIEIQQLCELLLPKLYSWSPEVAEYVEKNIWKKNKLAP